MAHNQCSQSKEEPLRYDRKLTLPEKQMVEENLALVPYTVAKIARRLPRTAEFEDLMQYGFLGLIEAADNYDGCRKAQFSTYACMRIKGAVLDGFNRNERPSNEWFFGPEDRETEHLFLEENGPAPDDQSPEEEAFPQEEEDKKALAAAFETLEQEEKEVVCAVYFEGYSLRALSRLCCLPRTHLAKVHNTALQKLKIQLMKL